MSYTLVFCTETACIPPARRPKSPSAAGLLPYRILEESAWWSEVRPAWWSKVRWGGVKWLPLLISHTLCWFPDFPRVTLLISRFPSTDFPISLVSLYWFPDFPLLISRFPSCHFFYWFPSISRFPLTLWSCQNSWFPLISPDFPISPPMWSCHSSPLDNSGSRGNGGIQKCTF